MRTTTQNTVQCEKNHKPVVVVVVVVDDKEVVSLFGNGSIKLKAH